MSTSPGVSSGKSLVEQVARKLCEQHRYDPDAKEPGDLPRCDGRGYGNEKPGQYREPWHWMWRTYANDARALIRLIKRASR